MAVAPRHLALVVCILCIVLFIFAFSETRSENMSSNPQPFRSKRTRLPPGPDPNEELSWFQGPRPLTREQLGRRAWGVLHTIAANLVFDESKGETESSKVKEVGSYFHLLFVPPPFKASLINA